MCKFFFYLTSVSCPFPLRILITSCPSLSVVMISVFDLSRYRRAGGDDIGFVVQGRFTAPAQPDNQQRKNRYRY